MSASHCWFDQIIISSGLVIKANIIIYHKGLSDQHLTESRNFLLTLINAKIARIYGETMKIVFNLLTTLVFTSP